MKKFLQSVLFLALLVCGLNLSAQIPDVKVDREENFTLVKILNSYHWPYDISNNKKHIAIQGFGAADSYYWSEETGAVALSGYAYAITDDGMMAGSYTNDLGMNVAGLWSPETQKWEFLGMNPEVPEFSEDGDSEYNGAWSMTNDGTKIGVMQIYPNWTTTSYIWTKENGYVKISNGDSPGTRPNAISDDGRIIAGLAQHKDKGEWTPCYWVDGEIKRFPHLFGEALNVSHNGNYICGYLLDGNAFVYDIRHDNLTKIANTLEPSFGVSATCVTDNGVVFGYSDGGSPADRKAVVYIGGELLFVQDYLKLNGIEDADTWSLYSINNVTADGKTLIGAGAIEGDECSFLLTINNICDGPANLTYTIENTNNIVLKWDAPADAENVTYEICTSYTGAPFVNGITETSFVFDNMDAGEYLYFIRANYNNGECLSDASNTVMPTIYPCAETDKCELTFVLNDYYNDGWDNGFISLLGSKSDIIYTVELTDSRDTIISENSEPYITPDTLILSLCPDTYQFTWNPGNWDEEIGFSIFFQDEELYRLDFGSIDTNFVKKPMFFEYELNCGKENINLPTVTGSPLEIYPNPVRNEIRISSDEIIEELAIYNINGQQTTVNRQQTSSSCQIINIGHLNPGVYFIKVKSANNEVMKKIVKL